MLSNSKSNASSTITQANNANFDIGFPLPELFSPTLTTCDNKATLNDGLDSLYANIPMPNVPVLPTMYNCSNVTITYNISFKNSQYMKYIGEIRKKINNSGIIFSVLLLLLF